MVAGLKQNNIKPGDGVSWEDLYAIDAGASTNFFTRSNLFVEIKVHSDGTTHAECIYFGSTAVDTADLANLPIGSTILCVGIAIPALYLHTAAAGTNTFKYQAINT